MKKILIALCALNLSVFAQNPIVYTSVIKIGNQLWAGENLSTKVFNNGDSIPHIQNPDEWYYASINYKPAWRYIDGDSTKGILYNGHVVTDPRGIVPKGYKIPNKKDFEILKEFFELNAVDSNIFYPYTSYDGYRKDQFSTGRYWSSTPANRFALGIDPRKIINQTEDGYTSLPGCGYKFIAQFYQVYNEEKLFNVDSKIITATVGYSTNEDGYSIRLIVE